MRELKAGFGHQSPLRLPHRHCEIQDVPAKVGPNHLGRSPDSFCGKIAYQQTNEISMRLFVSTPTASEQQSPNGPAIIAKQKCKTNVNSKSPGKSCESRMDGPQKPEEPTTNTNEGFKVLQNTFGPPYVVRSESTSLRPSRENADLIGAGAAPVATHNEFTCVLTSVRAHECILYIHAHRILLEEGGDESQVAFVLFA